MTVGRVAYLFLLLLIPACDATLISQDQTVGGQPGRRQTWREGTVNESQPLFVVSTGRLTIQDVDIDLAGTTSVPGGPEFATWLQLPWLAKLNAGAQLSLLRVTIHMQCSTLQQVQAAACSMGDLGKVRSLQIMPGVLQLPLWFQPGITMQQVQLYCNASLTPPTTTWHPLAKSIQPPNSQLQLTNTTVTTSSASGNITCTSFMFSQVQQNGSTAPFLGFVPLDSIPVTPVSHSTPYTQDPAGTPPLQCVVAQVTDWQQLASLSYGLQAWARTLHMVLSQNVSLPKSSLAASNGTIFVYRNVFLVPQPSWPYPTFMDLGYVRGMDAWTVSPDGANITFDSLQFTSLPLGPPSKLPWSLYTWNMWAVNTDTCHEIPGVNITITNCIMLIERQTMDYMSYWANELASPFPDRRAAASWYLNDTTCNKTLGARGPLAQNVEFVDQHNWHIEAYFTYGMKTIINTTLLAFPGANTTPPAPATTTTQNAAPQDAPAAAAAGAGLTSTGRSTSAASRSVGDALAVAADTVSGHGTALVLVGHRLTAGSGSGGAGRAGRASGAGHAGRAGCASRAGRAGTGSRVLAQASQPAAPQTQLPVYGPGVPGGTTAALAVYMHVAGDHQQHISITDLFESPYTPFSEITWATDASTFVQALTDPSMPPNVALLANLSVPTSMWPTPSPAALQHSVVIAGWLGVLTLLDWQGASSVVSLLDGVTVTHRHLTVMNAGMGNPANINPSSDAYYTAYQWQFSRAPSHTRAISFQDANLLLPSPELAQLKKPGSPVSQALNSTNDNAQSIAINTAYMNSTGPNGEATASYIIPYRGADPSAEVQLRSFAHAGVLATDITLNTAPAPGSSVLPFSTVSAPFSVDWASVQSAVNPSAGGGGSGSKLGLAVGLPVGLGVAVITAVMALWLISRRKAAAAAAQSHTKAAVSQQPDEEQAMLPPSPVAASATGSDSVSPGAAAIPTTIQQAYSSGASTGRGLSGPTRPAAAVHRAKSHRLSWRATDNQAPFPQQPPGPWLMRQTSDADGDDEDWDDFDAPPDHDDMLLINNLDVSRDFRGDMFARGAADVAAGLRDMVARMQQELGSEEFQIERVLGKGGGGVVYQGTWRGLVVAVKVVEFTVTASGHMSRAHHRAITEAALCKTLQHPNIVATYAYDLHSLDTPTDPLTSHSVIGSSSILGSGPISLQQQPSAPAVSTSGLAAGSTGKLQTTSGCLPCRPAVSVGSIAGQGMQRATSTPLCQAAGQAGDPPLESHVQPPPDATQPTHGAGSRPAFDALLHADTASGSVETSAGLPTRTGLRPHQGPSPLLAPPQPILTDAFHSGGQQIPTSAASDPLTDQDAHASSGTVLPQTGHQHQESAAVRGAGVLAPASAGSLSRPRLAQQDHLPRPETKEPRDHLEQDQLQQSKLAALPVPLYADRAAPLWEHLSTGRLGSVSSLQESPGSQPATIRITTPQLASNETSLHMLPSSLVAVAPASIDLGSHSSRLSAATGSICSMLSPAGQNRGVTPSHTPSPSHSTLQVTPSHTPSSSHSVLHVTPSHIPNPSHSVLPTPASSGPLEPELADSGKSIQVATLAGAGNIGGDVNTAPAAFLLKDGPTLSASAPEQLAAVPATAYKSAQQLQMTAAMQDAGSRGALRQAGASAPLPHNPYHMPGKSRSLPASISGSGSGVTGTTIVSVTGAPLSYSSPSTHISHRRRSSASQVLPAVSEVCETTPDGARPLSQAASQADTRSGLRSAPSNGGTPPTAPQPRGPATASGQLRAGSPAPSGLLNPGSPARSNRPSHLFSNTPAEAHSGTTGKECSMRFRLYIIQEYCDGGTLKAAIDEHRLQDMSMGAPRPVLSHVLQLACDVAAGLAHVHSRRVIHGDLTPANVLLKTMGGAESGFAAKIADFGLSWKLPDLGQGDHVANAKQGTRFYMAPEVKHVGIMSKSADIFSFGMLMHEMYHGTPFWRKPGVSLNADLLSAASRHAGESLVWDANCPHEYRKLVMSCVANDPNARPTIDRVVLSLLQQQRTVHDAAANAHQIPVEVAPTEPGSGSPAPPTDIKMADYPATSVDDLAGLPLSVSEGEALPSFAALELSTSPTTSSISARGLQQTPPQSRAASTSNASETRFHHTISNVSSTRSGEASQPASSQLLHVPSVSSARTARGDNNEDSNDSTSKLLRSVTLGSNSTSMQRAGYSEPLHFIRTSGLDDEPCLASQLCVVEEVSDEGLTSGSISSQLRSGPTGAPSAAVSGTGSPASESTHLSTTRSQALSTTPPSSEPQPSVTVEQAPFDEYDVQAHAQLPLHGLSQSSDNLAAAVYPARRWTRQPPRKVPTAGLLQEREWRQVISAWNAPVVPIASRQAGTKSSTLYEQKVQASPHRRSAAQGVQKPSRTSSPPFSQLFPGSARKRGGSSRSSNGAPSTGSVSTESVSTMPSTSRSPSPGLPRAAAASQQGLSSQRSAGVAQTLYGLARPGTAAGLQQQSRHTSSRAEAAQFSPQHSSPALARSQIVEPGISQQAEQLLAALRLPQSSPSRLGPADFMLDKTSSYEPAARVTAGRHVAASGPRAFTFKPHGQQQQDAGVELTSLPHARMNAPLEPGVSSSTNTPPPREEGMAVVDKDRAMHLLSTSSMLARARQSNRDSCSNTNSITISNNIPPAFVAATTKSSSTNSPGSTPSPSRCPSPGPTEPHSPCGSHGRPSCHNTHNSKLLAVVDETEVSVPSPRSQQRPLRDTSGISSLQDPVRRSPVASSAAASTGPAWGARGLQLHADHGRIGAGLAGTAPVVAVDPYFSFASQSHSQSPSHSHFHSHSQSHGQGSQDSHSPRYHAVFSSSTVRHAEQEAPAFFASSGQSADTASGLHPLGPAETDGQWSSDGGWLLDHSRDHLGGVTDVHGFADVHGVGAANGWQGTGGANSS